MNISYLPNDILIKIFQDLDISALGAVAAVCQKANLIQQSDLVWKSFFQRYIDDDSLKYPTWKEQCKLLNNFLCSRYTVRTFSEAELSQMHLFNLPPPLQNEQKVLLPDWVESKRELETYLFHQDVITIQGSVQRSLKTAHTFIYEVFNVDPVFHQLSKVIAVNVLSRDAKILCRRDNFGPLRFWGNGHYIIIEEDYGALTIFKEHECRLLSMSEINIFRDQLNLRPPEVRFFHNWLLLCKNRHLKIVNLDNGNCLTTIHHRNLDGCRDIQMVDGKILAISHQFSWDIPFKGSTQDIYTIFDF